MTGPSATTADSTPEITWNALAGAIHYELLVYNARLGQEVLHADHIEQTSFTVPAPLPFDRYVAFVRGIDVEGQPGSWGARWEFTIEIGRPTLTDPTGALTDNTPTLTWNGPETAETYELLIYNLRLGREAVGRTGITEDSFTLQSPLMNDRYQAFVRAMTAAGPSEYSAPLYFEVAVALPAAPSFNGPFGTTLETQPTVVWNGVEGAESYQLLVYHLRLGREIFNQQGLTDTSWTLTDLQPQTSYQAFVRAVDAAGNNGAWSKPLEFTIVTDYTGSPQWTGEVRMVRDAAGAWHVLDPFGEELDTQGDACQGLETAIAYATGNGYRLNVIGGGVQADRRDTRVIHCSRTITFPPMQGTVIEFNGVTLNFSATVTGPGIVFDSMMMVDFEFQGQIVHHGHGPAVVFRPRNLLPLDEFVGPTIVDSRFYIHTVYSQAADSLVDFSLTDGPVTNSEFRFIELNTDGGWHGMRMLGPRTFMNNLVSVRHLHLNRGDGVRVGTDSSARIFGNDFDFAIQPATGGGGVEVWGSSNLFRLSVTSTQGEAARSLIWQAPARDNLLIRRTLSAPILDFTDGKNRML